MKVFQDFSKKKTCSRKNVLVVSLLFLVSTLCAQEIKLSKSDVSNKQTITVKLYEVDSGDFLLELPLTFHITQDNILFMIVGGNNGVDGEKSVWMFDRTIGLKELLNKNRNIEGTKSFKKHHEELFTSFSLSGNVQLFKNFLYGYEFVQSLPKPVFFRIKDIEKQVELKLRFYVSYPSDKNEYLQLLTAETGIIKTIINISK